MNEFTAKKLGEVLAFAQVGLETCIRGEKALTEVLGESEVKNIIATNKNHIATLETLAGKNGDFGTITKNKSVATGEKLRKMRDLYVGDEWDNGVELLEWSGFFEGAALVHWKLVHGASVGINEKSLTTLSIEAIAFHQKHLETSGKTLESIGTKRSISK